jgi:hypothetical protein
VAVTLLKKRQKILPLFNCLFNYTKLLPFFWRAIVGMQQSPVLWRTFQSCIPTMASASV